MLNDAHSSGIPLDLLPIFQDASFIECLAVENPKKTSSHSNDEMDQDEDMEQELDPDLYLNPGPEQRLKKLSQSNIRP